MMDVKQFERWVQRAAYGDEVEYYRGLCCAGSGTARMAYDCAVRGQVFLYQRRVHFGVFSYMARRVSPKAGAMLAP